MMASVCRESSTNLCDILYRDYYEVNQGYSSQTSSFWKKYGEFQRVQKSGNDYKLEGKGFGDFVQKSKIRSIINLPTKIYLSYILKASDPGIVKGVRWVSNQQSREFSYSLARMALTLDLLSKKVPDLATKTFCIIGDGYGALGCLIKKVFPRSKIIYVNLGRTLIFDLYYSQKSFPEMAHALVRTDEDNFSSDFNYIEAEYFGRTHCDADVFINIDSMQEMNYDAISTYFNAIRSQAHDAWFYCCNRISKTLPDGTVINFQSYGWSDRDQIIFDELCPWAQRYPKNKPPFYGKSDGLVKHRLIKIAQKI